jgi:hypothetical protein
MSNTLRILPLLAVVLAAAAGPASAAGEKIIDNRQARQEHRTDQGIANGNLTERETARIEWRSTKLNAAEDKALSDGSMSKGEARRLSRAYDRQSEFIHRQKHDGQSQ